MAEQARRNAPCPHDRQQVVWACSLRRGGGFPAVVATCLDCGATASNVPSKENR